MNRNRSIKPSTIIIVLECVFLAVVFFGYSLLSSRPEKNPVAAAPETASTQNPTLTPPSVPATVDKPADSPVITDPPPSELELRTTEIQRTTETQLPEIQRPETPSPNAGTLKRPREIVESLRSRGSSSTDGFINIGPLIEFQLNTETRSRFFHDASLPGLNTDDWWLPARSDRAFVLKTRGKLSAIYSVSLTTARCTKIASFPQQTYLAARGDESEIYLLRTDNTDKRFRLIADLFSLQTLRVTSTRTLLDLPLMSSKQVDRFVWDPLLASLAISLLEPDSRKEPNSRTHLVNLRTGQRIETTKGEVSVGNSLPLGFSGDGQRLFLASLFPPERTKRDGAEADLIELDLTQNRRQDYGSPELPKQIPFQISSDARWLVYADANQAEVWNAETGKRHTVIPIDSASSGPEHPLRFSFAAGDQWIAYDNGESLKIHLVDTGRLLASLPKNDNDQENRSESFVTLFSKASDSGLLVFGIDVEAKSSTLQSGADGSNFPSPWLRRLSIPLANAKLPSGHEVEAIPSSKQDTEVAITSAPTFTNWMSPREYDAVFTRLASGKKYPITVEGRFHQGQREYRGCFVDRPEKFEFVSHHDQLEGAINKLAQRYGQRGFCEVWRQSFVDDEGKTWWSAIWTTPPAVLESSK